MVDESQIINRGVALLRILNARHPESLRKALRYVAGVLRRSVDQKDVFLDIADKFETIAAMSQEELDTECQ